MLWVAALLSMIIWVLGWVSGFLGPVIHVFLLFAALAILAAWLPPPTDTPGDDAPEASAPPATSAADPREERRG